VLAECKEWIFWLPPSCASAIGTPRSEMQVFGLLMLRGSGGAHVHGRGIRRTGILMLDLLIHI
jgi:hypothetical protein